MVGISGFLGYLWTVPNLLSTVHNVNLRLWIAVAKILRDFAERAMIF
jgi:hypothetical protein